MSTTIKIRYVRSDKWRQEMAVATGQSVSREGVAEIAPSELSAEARRLICENGYYSTHAGFRLRCGSIAPVSATYDDCDNEIDSLDPTRTELSDAIVAAYKACVAKREAAALEAAAKEAADKAKAEEWASFPLEWRASAEGVGHCRPHNISSDGYRGPLSAYGSVQYDKGKLGQYAPVAYQEAMAEHKRLKDVAERAEMRDEIKALKEKLGTLSEFLSVIPQDALRGALRAMVKVSDFDGELRERIEDAATCHIFDEDEAEVE